MEPVLRYIDGLARLGANPGVAGAIQKKRELIGARFAEAVRETMPAGANHAAQAMGPVVEQLIETLLRHEAGRLAALEEAARGHGAARFKDGRGVEDVVGEYRLLRAIVVDELYSGLRRGEFTFPGMEVVAANAAIDLAMQHSVAALVEEEKARLRIRAEAETKYLSYLSHDLRNNLNGITLTIDVLREHLRNMPEVAEECDSLLAGRGAIWETMEGMERLMEAERLKKKAVEVKLAPVRMRDAVERVVANMRKRAQAKGLEMENRIPEDLVLELDEQLLRLVVQNLAGNALRYTDRGAIHLGTERDGDGRHVLTVGDTGRGISPEDQVKVFEAFRRGESHGEPGMGLGLAIVSAAAKLMGAAVEVESEVGKGSIFRVVMAETKEVRRP